ncbi:hypothetical protein [Rhodopila sp.]|uniref:hypothetical protein n=1 Tax=Rhodopila sp. TaxID=2480087 RepID=UPI002C653631|nr:hypothetical protein [Rhodopila sp.]HVZ10710.1 hypothetical protein [Rhodopila sp.]
MAYGRKHNGEPVTFRKSLEDFEPTPEVAEQTMRKIERAFDAGENEVMIASFPSSFCRDTGRAISNAGEPPIVEPDPTCRTECAALDQDAAERRATYFRFLEEEHGTGWFSV